MKIDERWVQQWVVPSDSSAREYIVSRDKDGNYACACPGWTRHTPRTDCKHITTVKAGQARTLTEHTIEKLRT